MALFVRCLSATLLLAVAACGSIKPMPSPVIPPNAKIQTDVKTKPFEDNHIEKALDENKTVIYHQEFGGGGLAVGLLLGPIGVAANIAGIGMRTSSDVEKLKGKVDFDTLALFADASKGSPLAEKDGSALVTLKPWISIVKTDDEDLLLGCGLRVDTTPSGGKWMGSYTWQTDFSVNFEEWSKGLSDARKQEANFQLRKCFAGIVDLYSTDLGGKLTLVKPPKLGPNGKPLDDEDEEENYRVKFNSVFVSPRMDFQMTAIKVAENDSRIAVRFPFSVVSLPKNQVKNLK